MRRHLTGSSVFLGGRPCSWLRRMGFSFIGLLTRCCRQRRTDRAARLANHIRIQLTACVRTEVRDSRRSRGRECASCECAGGGGLPCAPEWWGGGGGGRWIFRRVFSRKLVGMTGAKLPRAEVVILRSIHRRRPRNCALCRLQVGCRMRLEQSRGALTGPRKGASRTDGTETWESRKSRAYPTTRGPHWPQGRVSRAPIPVTQARLLIPPGFQHPSSPSNQEI